MEVGLYADDSLCYFSEIKVLLLWWRYFSSHKTLYMYFEEKLFSYFLVTLRCLLASFIIIQKMNSIKSKPKYKEKIQNKEDNIIINGDESYGKCVM